MYMELGTMGIEDIDLGQLCYGYGVCRDGVLGHKQMSVRAWASLFLK
jgi:hypothetical protein